MQSEVKRKNGIPVLIDLFTKHSLSENAAAFQIATLSLVSLANISETRWCLIFRQHIEALENKP